MYFRKNNIIIIYYEQIMSLRVNEAIWKESNIYKHFLQ